MEPKCLVVTRKRLKYLILQCKLSNYLLFFGSYCEISCFSSFFISIFNKVLDVNTMSFAHQVQCPVSLWPMRWVIVLQLDPGVAPLHTMIEEWVILAVCLHYVDIEVVSQCYVIWRRMATVNICSVEHARITIYSNGICETIRNRTGFLNVKWPPIKRFSSI